MTPGYAVIWVGKATTGFLTTQGLWSLDPTHAHVFETKTFARSRARSFKGSVVVEAWV